MKFDCGFTRGDRWFRYRAAAIIVEEGSVLFAQNDRDDYLYSVGGAVEMCETAEDAVRREVFEETGVHYEVDRLALIHENFFEGEGSLSGFHCHEVAFYFLMKSRGTMELDSHSTTSDGLPERMVWIPIADLAQYRHFPDFLGEKLQRMYPGVEHIVTHEMNARNAIQQDNLTP
ncbi:MAG: NUDIX hydrolase [Faecousia sp.]